MKRTILPALWLRNDEAGNLLPNSPYESSEYVFILGFIDIVLYS
jgi:hypothetical protein